MNEDFKNRIQEVQNVLTILNQDEENFVLFDDLSELEKTIEQEDPDLEFLRTKFIRIAADLAASDLVIIDYIPDYPEQEEQPVYKDLMEYIRDLNSWLSEDLRMFIDSRLDMMDIRGTDLEILEAATGKEFMILNTEALETSITDDPEIENTDGITITANQLLNGEWIYLLSWCRPYPHLNDHFMLSEYKAFNIIEIILDDPEGLDKIIKILEE